MQRREVSSSQIRSIGHDETTNTLEVEFASNGAVYQYENVPREVYVSLIGAGSVGSYFNANVKGNSAYPYRRV